MPPRVAAPANGRINVGPSTETVAKQRAISRPRQYVSRWRIWETGLDADGRLRLWPLWWDLSQAWLGPALLDMLPGRGVRRLTLGKIPEGGVHIDVRQQTVGVWHTADTMGIFQALPGVWSGWQAEGWEDRFAEQVIRCSGALRVPAVDTVAGIDSAQAWIHDRVFQSYSDSPAGQVRKLVELLDPVGPGLVVSDGAVADSAVHPRRAEWSRFVEGCKLVREIHAESA